jgi:mono/diheme cytochrome c family protein
MTSTLESVAAGLLAVLALTAAGSVAVAGEAETGRVAALDDALLDGLQTVVVSQSPDTVYGHEVDYEAWPMARIVTLAYPDWKQLVARDAVLILRAHGGYEPLMMFSKALTGEAYVTRRIAGRSADAPYDCWTEGGSEHCDLGRFLVWTDGRYPERPQPWGLRELVVVDFVDAFGRAIPDSDDPQVREGFELYKQYCIECHRVNFQGGRKATDHVVRDVKVSRESLAFFVHQYRRVNPATYMPDYRGILDGGDIDRLHAYLAHMFEHQNVCDRRPPDPRCPGTP